MLILYASSESFLVKEDGTDRMAQSTETEDAKADAKHPGGFHRVVLNCSHCSEETNETEDEENVFFHDFIISVFCSAKQLTQVNVLHKLKIVPFAIAQTTADISFGHRELCCIAEVVAFAHGLKYVHNDAAIAYMHLSSYVVYQYAVAARLNQVEENCIKLIAVHDFIILVFCFGQNHTVGSCLLLLKVQPKYRGHDQFWLRNFLMFSQLRSQFPLRRFESFQNQS